MLQVLRYLKQVEVCAKSNRLLRGFYPNGIFIYAAIFTVSNKNRG